MALLARDSGDREIVVAVVAPVGSPVERTVDALTAAFVSTGHSVSQVRISEMLDTTITKVKSRAGAPRLERLMDKGDAFRKLIKDDAACGYLASLAILNQRVSTTGSWRKQRSQHVNVVRSLKTQGEVEALRAIYGERVIVVGVSAPEDTRRRTLKRQLRSEVPLADLDATVARLMARDEKDAGQPLGQRMRDAYQMSDAFLSVRRKRDGASARRLVELLLGEPWRTPTRDEQGMFHAWAAKFRSSASGRQVGVAIVDDLGEVVVVGCNDVPKPGGGQYWEDDSSDQRDFELGYDANDHGKFNAATDLLQGLADAGWLKKSKRKLASERRAEEALKANGPLSGSRVNDLVEFGRIVHAEMAALMTAAREGRSVRGCTLYTTTYPCHECARLIIGAGIARVVYIDPYQKSMAPEMYEDMFDDSRKAGTVCVEQFVGVSPRLFPRVFEMTNRERDVRGNYSKWTTPALVLGAEEPLVDVSHLQEIRCALYVNEVAPAFARAGRPGSSKS